MAGWNGTADEICYKSLRDVGQDADGGTLWHTGSLVTGRKVPTTQGYTSIADAERVSGSGDVVVAGEEVRRGCNGKVAAFAPERSRVTSASVAIAARMCYSLINSIISHRINYSSLAGHDA